MPATNRDEIGVIPTGGPQETHPHRFVKGELRCDQHDLLVGFGNEECVEIDDRDIRGGEKKWHHVKRGVPLRLEIGPKDIEKDSVFVGRRDQPKSIPMDRSQLISTVGSMLADMQRSLYDKALNLRKENSKEITSESDFRDFFSSRDENEIHGGFAHCHFSDEDQLEPLLKELKVTIRCIPRDGHDNPGTCFFTGQPTDKKAIFAKAY